MKITGKQMCEEIVRFMAPGVDESKLAELADKIWNLSPTGELGHVVSMYEHMRVQQILLGEREQDAFPEDPKFGDQVLRVFVLTLPDRRVVRRMTFTGSFWLCTQFVTE